MCILCTGGKILQLKFTLIPTHIIVCCLFVVDPETRIRRNRALHDAIIVTTHQQEEQQVNDETVVKMISSWILRDCICIRTRNFTVWECSKRHTLDRETQDILKIHRNLLCIFSCACVTVHSNIKPPADSQSKATTGSLFVPSSCSFFSETSTNHHHHRHLLIWQANVSAPENTEHRSLREQRKSEHHTLCDDCTTSCCRHCVSFEKTHQHLRV